MKWINVLMAFALVLGMGAFAGCSDDDSGPSGTTAPTDPDGGLEPGSARATTSPRCSSTLFNYDTRASWSSTRTGTVSLTTRVAGGATATINGTYAVTESASGYDPRDRDRLPGLHPGRDHRGRRR